MSGETGDHISGWTVDTLNSMMTDRLEKYDQDVRLLITERTTATDLRFDALMMILDERDRRYEQRFLAQEKAVAAALIAAREAVLKAEAAAEKRFDSVNEFRGQLADQARTFMPRQESEQLHHQTTDKIGLSNENLRASIDALASRMDRSEGKSTGTTAGWAYTAAAVGVVASIIASLIAILAISGKV